MHLGLDLDNTIIHYDALFYSLAHARGYVEEDLPQTKRAVRRAVRDVPGGRPKWIELQGRAYGLDMGQAELAPGVEAFLKACQARPDVKVSIVSHRTEYPVSGGTTSLHEAARAFLRAKGLLGEGAPLREADVNFRVSRQLKIARAVELGCTHFVDDLIEVLTDPTFPAELKGIHYSPESEAELPPSVERVATWAELQAKLLGS